MLFPFLDSLDRLDFFLLLDFFLFLFQALKDWLDKTWHDRQLQFALKSQHRLSLRKGGWQSRRQMLFLLGLCRFKLVRKQLQVLFLSLQILHQLELRANRVLFVKLLGHESGISQVDLIA